MKTKVMCLLAAGTISSQAAIVLNTGFSGVSQAGTTASGFSWTSDLGEEANATTSLAFTGSATGFIAEAAGTGEAGEPIGVAGNIETVGPWSTSFQFTPSQTLSLSSFDISSYSISGGGAHQGNPKSVQWTLNIVDGVSIFNDSLALTEPGGAGPANFVINTTGVTLNANTTYTFQVTVSSPVPSGGNNIALNSFTLNGEAIPEPSSAVLIGLAGMGFIMRRRK